MKTTSLFRLGGGAILLAQILFAFGNLSYFLPAEQLPPTVTLWIATFGYGFLSLGLCALYARQSQQGGLLGLLGFILLLWGIIADVGNIAVRHGVVQGIVSEEQVAQVPSYVAVDQLLNWVWMLGLVILGLSIYRAGIFPKYIGLLFILLGLTEIFTGPLEVIRPFFMILSFAAWTWPGLLLLTGRDATVVKAIPAASG